MSTRIYPRGWIAAVVVWLLDRLPGIRDEVLSAYWSPIEIFAINNVANDLGDTFGGDDVA